MILYYSTQAKEILPRTHGDCMRTKLSNYACARFRVMRSWLHWSIKHAANAVYSRYFRDYLFGDLLMFIVICTSLSRCSSITLWGYESRISDLIGGMLQRT
ncbi:hypothetical protein CDAR_280421 [Caerostris darwini]|uniref:Uncharacterized protein n=1 Tax=Caerostris darwini TaxID=1538125 RepID=A0AAV4VF33_9ARAC|nr:hypothetical protein CDAR_280421 [Caerostris darwini]